jgi:hypothetical protein
VEAAREGEIEETEVIDTIQQLIGVRGELTRRAAKAAARAWKDWLQRAPYAQVYLTIGGYDDDPRDLWEFDEVRTFVQQFARFRWD